MLKSEEEKKFPITCPWCQTEVKPDDYFGWLEIFDNLDMFGKTVYRCEHCKRYFVIREGVDGSIVIYK